MAEYSNAEVRAVSALRDRRHRINSSRQSFEQLTYDVRRELGVIASHCAETERRRWQELQACEADPDRDCSRLRHRYTTAARVRIAVERLSGEILQMVALRRSRVDDYVARTADWLWRLANHLEGIGPPPEDTGTVAAGPGRSGGLAAPTSSEGSTSPGQGGSLFGRNLERVALSSVSVPRDLFEREPAKGSATLEDMMWAAATFREVVIPHLMRGGTRDQLREMDRAAGNEVGLRRLEGAWEVYLGDDTPKVDRSADGGINVTTGRHRILAAQLVGLSWLPMRVSDVGVDGEH